MKRLIHLSYIVATLLMPSAYAAEALPDKALSATVETNQAEQKIPDVLDCPKDMSKEACTRLQYEHYANHTDRAYNEFLKNETNTPLSDQIIKKPLLTQPLQQP